MAYNRGMDVAVSQGHAAVCSRRFRGNPRIGLLGVSGYAVVRNPDLDPGCVGQFADFVPEESAPGPA